MSDQPYTIGQEMITTDASRDRHDLLLRYGTKLRNNAYRAIHTYGMTTDQFAVVCIRVDSEWRDLVESLMPGRDWQQYRDRFEDPIASGTVTRAVVECVIDAHPSLRKVLHDLPTAGKVTAIVLDDTGASVYEIEPQLDETAAA